MPIINGSLSHRFNVSSVDKIFDTDISINVVKRREQILYRTNLPTSSTNVSYISGQKLSSDINLSIGDRSTSLGANRITNVTSTIIEEVKTFSIETENFVVTDVFSDTTNTTISQPLFYKHIINPDNLSRVDFAAGDLLLASGITLVSIELLDIDFLPVQTSEIKLDLINGIIYNNTLSEYNNSGNYIIYYIRYTINDNGSIKTFVDLLDNQFVYKLATFDDLSPTLEIITDDRKVYLIEEVIDIFNITLPIINTYAFRPLDTSKIQIIKSTNSDITDSWFVKISNGTFFTNLNGILYKYYISEFLTQAFTPAAPIKQSLQERSVRLSKSIIKLDNENINNSVDFNIHVLINDSNDIGQIAFTTDSALINVIASNGLPYKKWDLINQVGIKSIDYKTGILELEGINIKSDYKIISTYFYNETYYEFTLINFNPISNKESLLTNISLFIDPDTTLITKSQTMFYLKSNTSGKVIESNWSQFNNDIKKHISGKTLYYEKLPMFLTTEIDDISEVNYIDPNTLLYFTDEFSVEGTKDGPILILGDITVAEAFEVSQLNTYDSRTRGGGIIEENFDAVLESNPEAKWFWDEGFWDGIPYPGNASYLVEIPVTSLKGAGGIFSPKQVRDVVNKHTAEGIYPVGKAYGLDITVTGIDPGGNSMRLLWSSKGF